MATITVRHPHHPKKRVAAAALGAALTLAAGLGAWQLMRPATRSADEAVTGTAPAPAAPVGTSVATQSRYQSTVYIVESEDAGELLRWSVANIADPNGPDTADLLRFHFVVVASNEDELRVQQELNDLDNIRDSMGLPFVRRIDLRQPVAPVAAGADAPPLSDQEMYQRLRPGASGTNAGPTAGRP